MTSMKQLAKKVGRDHDLAAELWKSGVYDAQMFATLIDEPDKVTRRQMEAWTKSFDNWAICDTACFCLFDRTPYAWSCARAWARSPREFVKRAGFAMMACLTVHDKHAPDAKYHAFLPMIEKAASDERNFVKKSVNWALRSIGKRNLFLNAAAIKVASRLARSDDPSARWVGKDALRELDTPKMRTRLAAKRLTISAPR